MHSRDDNNPLQPRTIKRNHTPRYIAHRVRESLTTRVSKFICTIFLGLLFLLGLIAFILWLSLRPHRPRFFIEEFTVQGLGQANGFASTEITFNVTARNSNSKIGLDYDTMVGTVYYKDQRAGSIPLLGTYYQEPKSTKIIYAVLSGASLAMNSEGWAAFNADRATGTVVFRLEITATVRFRLFSRQTKHHTLHANCDAPVGQDGMILAAAKQKKCPTYFT